MTVTVGVLAVLEDGRQAHLGGEIAATLMQVAPELLARDPDIRPVDLLAVK